DGTNHVAKSRGGKKIGVPKLLSTVHVEGINLIVLSSDEQHVVRCSPNREARQVERLSINVALHCKSSALAERLFPNIRQGEDRFLRVRIRAVIVVVIRGDSDLRYHDGRTQEQPHGEAGTAQYTGTHVLHTDRGLLCESSLMEERRYYPTKASGYNGFLWNRCTSVRRLRTRRACPESSRGNPGYRRIACRRPAKQ